MANVPAREAAAGRYPELLQLVGGEFRPGSGRPVDVLDPTTGRMLGQYREAGPEEIEAALERAAQGFARWRATPLDERSRILHRIADTILAQAETLAELVVLELGKPVAEARTEVGQAADLWRWAAEECRRLYGRLVPTRNHRGRQMVLHEPVGPVAGFSSWNAPLITPSRKMSSALGAGCSVIMKASEEVPAAALALGRIAYECGLPEGVLSILMGDAESLSKRLLDSPVIRCITFTGSTRVGKLLAGQASAQMKRAIMELGGHAPVLVFDDVDVEAVAKAAARAKFRNSGQVCTSPTRFYVQAGVYRAFTEVFAAEARSLRLGCGFDPRTEMGPLVDERRIAATQAFVADARARGLEIVAGGVAREGEGFFFEPTVIANAGTDAMISNVEPFGPVAMTAPFETYDEAIALANRLPFALAAYVHSTNVNTINNAIDDVAAGNVICNGWRASLPETPFGGHKDSGMGSEGGIEGLHAFLNVKYASIG